MKIDFKMHTPLWHEKLFFKASCIFCNEMFILTFFYERRCWIQDIQVWKWFQQPRRYKSPLLLSEKSLILYQQVNHLVEFQLCEKEKNSYVAKWTYSICIYIHTWPNTFIVFILLVVEFCSLQLHSCKTVAS